MAQLANAIVQVNRIEQAKIWDANEAALTIGLPQSPVLDDDARRRVAPFLQWCAIVQVRHAPAKPTTVAAFVLSQASLGVDQETILTQIEAVQQLHDHFG